MMRLFNRSLSWSLVAAFALSIPVPAQARPLSTELAPQYGNLEIDPKNCFLPVVPEMAPDGNSPKTEPLTDKYEKKQTFLPNAMIVKPGVAAPELAKASLEYLVGSKSMMDSVKLRMIARIVKLDLIKKSGDAKYAEWYKTLVGLPIAMFIGFDTGAGPACGPLPLHMTIKGQKIFWNTITFIEDIPGPEGKPAMFSIMDAAKNDTLGLVTAHENAHGIMFDMYGDAGTVLNKEKKSNIGHDGPIISDRSLAFVEGWAEAFEALYGPANPLLSLKESEREKYRLSEFLFTRQDPVRRDRYIWSNLQKKTGILKTGLQLIATEGVNASIFYDLLTNRALKEAFAKSVRVMASEHPIDIAQFVKAYGKQNPGDKQTLFRIFLEGTNYATASNEARKLYHDYYVAKLGYVQKKIEKAAFEAARAKYVTFKEELFKKALADDAVLTANVGPDLWIELQKNEVMEGLRVNLNLAPAGFLKKIKLAAITDEELDKLIEARSAMGYFQAKSAFEVLTKVLGAERAKAIIEANGMKEI